MEYKILPSLAEHITSPFVWTNHFLIKSRSIISIENLGNRKKIYCEIAIIDDNFKKKYNESPYTNKLPEDKKILIINEWYRNCLMVEKNKDANIEIKKVNDLFVWFWRMRASFIHPDNTIRLAVYLAFLSVILGIIGLV